MSTVKRGDVVLLVLGGKTFNALVHQVTSTPDSHLGANDEPALHLSYIPDEIIVNGKPKVQPIGYIPPSAMIYDVVHASHEFSAEYMREHNLRPVPKDNPLHATLQQQIVQAETEIRNRRGAGEWKFMWEALPEGTLENPAKLEPFAVLDNSKAVNSVPVAPEGTAARVVDFSGEGFNSQAKSASQQIEDLAASIPDAPAADLPTGIAPETSEPKE